MPGKAAKKLSQKQAQLYLYLIEFIEKHGFQPTQREMAEHFGVDKKAIADRLRGLQRAGVIQLPGAGLERAIRFPFVRFKAGFHRESNGGAA